MRRYLLSFGVLLAAGLTWFALRGGAGHERVDSATAHELVGQGARLVDVRSPAEYSAGHIAGAVNIPVGELGGRMQELEPKDRPIVLYCRSGRRSASAFDQLEQAGFSKLYDLGGMSSW